MHGLGLFLGFKRMPPYVDAAPGTPWIADFSDLNYSGLIAAMLIGA